MMKNKKTYNVLIIDDHPTIIEAFKNALKFIVEESEQIHFNVSSASTSEAAYQKLQAAKKKQNLDLVIVDISLPPAPKLNINSGIELGVILRKELPSTKILVCTFYSQPYKIHSILHAVNPMGFLNKQDVGFKDFIIAISDVLKDKTHYSPSIIKALKNKVLDQMDLDDNDIFILRELSNGAKMRDMIKLIPLSKSGIEKRKRQLKRKLKIASDSDRDLVLAAKAKGLI